MLARPSEDHDKKVANKIYVIEPGKLDTIKVAASHFVKDVLDEIPGGRAKITDILDEVNKRFIALNPRGWVGTSTDYGFRDDKGCFTVAGLRRQANVKEQKAGKSAPFHPWYRCTRSGEIYLVDDAATVSE